MKYPEIKIHIPEPCDEKWHLMTPTEKGRFCHSCTRELVDFSAKSDEEILQYLKKNDHICGRFHTSQLDRTLIADRKKRNHWLSYAASLLLPITLFSQETKSTSKKVIKTTQVDTTTYKSLDIGALKRKAKIATQIQNDSMTIYGTVKDDSNVPLPGASVVIKGTTIGVSTDFDGNFSLTVQSGNILKISYVSYTDKEIKVNENRGTIYNVSLSPAEDLEVHYFGYITYSTPEGADQFGYVSDYDKTSYPKPMTEKEIKERDQRTKNYFTFQKKKWKEKREKRRAKRIKRNK